MDVTVSKANEAENCRSLAGEGTRCRLCYYVCCQALEVVMGVIIVLITISW